MSPDQPPAGPASIPMESVVEFGTGPDERSRPSRRRWNVSGLARSLAADRRVVPLAAVLGAVALFGSLVSEWQITMVDTTVFQGAETGMQPVPTDVGDLGAWGAGYLAGLFVLVAATVLVLFGPRAGRRTARLIGLSTGGLLFALLAALEPTLDEVSRTLGYLIRYQLEAGQVHQAAGRGIWCAFAGVVAVLVALYLAGRHGERPGPAEPRASAEPPVDGTAAGPEPAAIWSWRRPDSAEEDQPPAAPFDLTVTSTTPFTSLTDKDRDKPTGRDGISG